MALEFVTDQFANLAITTAKLNTAAVTAAKADLTDTWSFASGTLRAADPTVAADVATKGYVDNIAAGLHWHESVRITTTGNITLSGTQTIDGKAIIAGDRVLVKNQSDASENGIYVCAAGAWARATDMDAGAEFPGAAMFVREGTLYGDTGWVCTNDAVNLGSDDVVFSQFTGGGALVGGDGIVITGNSVAADLKSSGGLEFSSGEIQIAASGVTNAMLEGSIANDKLSNSAVTVTAGTGLSGGGSVSLGGTTTINVSGLTNSEIAANAGVAYSKLTLTGSVVNADISASAAIADSKLDTIATANKVSGSALQLASGSGLEDDSGIKISAGGVSNAMLANSSVSLGGVSIALGATDATPAFDLQDATGYAASALVGNITNSQLEGSIGDNKLLTIATADKVSINAINIDGGTDIGAALADGDLIVVDDGGGGTNRKCTMLRVAQHAYAGVTGGDVTINSSGEAAIGSGVVENAMLANSSVSFGGISVALGASDATPAFDLSDATNYPAASLSGTLANNQLANSSVSFGGISVALGAADATPAFDLSDATNYPTSSLVGTITNTQLAGSIANNKLSNSAVTVTAGSGIAGGGNVSLGGSVSVTADVDDVSIGIDGGDKIGIKAGGVTLDNLAFQPRHDKFTGNGNTLAFNLSTRILNANYRKFMVVARNGQILEYVDSNPSGTSQFTVSDDSNNTTITFGSNISNNDVITAMYFA